EVSWCCRIRGSIGDGRDQTDKGAPSRTALLGYDMNRRNYVAVIGLVAAVAGLSLGATAQAAEKAKGPAISSCLLKPLKAAQDAQKAQNWTLNIQKLQEAEAEKCTKTPYDEFLMNSWLAV